MSSNLIFFKFLSADRAIYDQPFDIPSFNVPSRKNEDWNWKGKRVKRSTNLNALAHHA